ncbi:MAG: GNAT family N-acetyltransferase [Muribaculaceae bacterium]|jgi:ribosomal protein S18 acetylase RimI-like enzyme|nr:GNAT family N-acetyltransferase [Muribaculaceae bacterium]
MNLRTLPIVDSLPDLPKVEALYVHSFPSFERAPFAYLVEPYPQVEFSAFYDADLFVGFVYIVTHSGISYIFYLAVAQEFRGKGYGSAILAQIRATHPSNRIILEIDDVSVKSADAPTRIRRKAFYLRNGYTENSVHIRMYGQPMEVLSQGGPITHAEYLALWKSLMQLFSSRTAVDAYLHEMFG